MSSKEIEERRNFLRCYKELTDEQKKLEIELQLREMIMSCFTYFGDIHTNKCINGVSKYYGRPYIDEYYDLLGKERTEEIYREQKEYFDTKCKVKSNVYTDYEGCTYNSLIEVE